MEKQSSGVVFLLGPMEIVEHGIFQAPYCDPSPVLSELLARSQHWPGPGLLEHEGEVTSSMSKLARISCPYD